MERLQNSELPMKLLKENKQQQCGRRSIQWYTLYSNLLYANYPEIIQFNSLAAQWEFSDSFTKFALSNEAYKSYYLPLTIIFLQLFLIS